MVSTHLPDMLPCGGVLNAGGGYMQRITGSPVYFPGTCGFPEGWLCNADHWNFPVQGFKKKGTEPRPAAFVKPHMSVDHDGIRKGFDLFKKGENPGQLPSVKLTGDIFRDISYKGKDLSRGKGCIPFTKQDTRRSCSPRAIANIHTDLHGTDNGGGTLGVSMDSLDHRRAGSTSIVMNLIRG